jgi:signal transduction histidine kinase
MNPRNSLAARWVRVSVGVLAVALTLFAAALLLMMHWHVHRQTDALLLEMAEAEATHLGDDDWSAHLGAHGSAGVGLPLQGSAAKAVVALLDAQCAVVGEEAAALLRTSPRWCEGLSAGGYAHFDIDEESPTPLRAIRLSVKGPAGAPMTLVVGIDHARIDGAVWQATKLTVPLWALILIGFGWVARAMSRWLTRDLERLGRDCEALDVSRAVAIDAPAAPFSVSGQAPGELVALSDTLNGLISRLRVVVEGQSQFIAEAAHELRTPLTALQGELELALRRERSREDYRAALSVALSDARRLSRLTDHLLEAAQTRAESLPLAAAALTPLVDAALGRVTRQLEAQGVVVSVEGCDDERDEGCIDRALLHPMSTARALDNLIQNALTYAQPHHLWLRLCSDGPWRTLWIEDDGPGLPPAVAQQLFTPFVRADAASSEGRGHGLGLYITHQLMERQGGDLSYHPATGAACGARWRLRWRKPEAE